MQTKELRTLYFGVNSNTPANTLLQNNISLYSWVTKNKPAPNFWGRKIVGDQALTRDEIEYLHRRGCKVAAIYPLPMNKTKKSHGIAAAEEAATVAAAIGIGRKSAIFCMVGDDSEVTTLFMKGYAQRILELGYTPAFMANTDANFAFDREFCRGWQTDREIFSQCVVWATSPSLKEFNRITTSHLIRPEEWIPFAPSAIKRADIAVWRYGAECHPIDTNDGRLTSFDLDLVLDQETIINLMF